MTRIVRLVLIPLVLTYAAPPARSFSLTDALCSTISGIVDASNMHLARPRVLSADYAISKFSSRGVAEAFGLAWRRSGNGVSSYEGVVLILRMADGGYGAREMGSTNEYKRFTFAWHPAAIAVIHTHPNSSDPKPQSDDIALADKHQVPVFTITSRGMYVYDPATRKTSKVTSDLEWLNPRTWDKNARITKGNHPSSGSSGDPVKKSPSERV